MAGLPTASRGEPTEFDRGVLHRYAQFGAAAAVFMAGLGVAVLAGWLWRVPLLTNVLSGAVPMKPNTAACVLAMGAALRGSRPGTSRVWRNLGTAGALLVIVVTAATLVEYVTHADLGLDLALFGDDPGMAVSRYPGRMAPNTATALLLLAAAQLVLTHAADRWVVVSQGLSLGAGALGMLGLYGYAYQVPELASPLGVTGMAVHTALGLTVSAVATFVARPTAGLARALAVRAKSAMMTRRMLTAAILVPPTLGWMRQVGEHRGLYGTPFGIALLVAANVVFFMVFTFRTGTRAVRLEVARRHAEAALAWHSAAAAMAEAAPDAMVGVDSHGVIILVNAQAERMFGYQRAEMLGRSVEMLVPDTIRGAHPLHRAAYLREPRVRRMGPDAALTVQRKDGTGIAAEISLSTLDTDGRRLIVAAVHDVGERIRLEHQLRDKNLQLEKAGEAKDAFLAAMSHELRTPLNAIIGFTGILLMGLPGPLNEEQVRQLQLVETGGQHLLSLINDVLDLAKIEAGQVEISLEHVDCAAAVSAIAASMRPQAADKDVALIVDLPQQPCIALVDRRALDQILINLIGNAVKFTNQGEVRVSLARDRTATPWRLTVSDTGPGIDVAEQGEVFNAFHRTVDARRRGDDGAGLGLYISRTLAELMGCRMHLTSSLGDGSAFTLTLAG